MDPNLIEPFTIEWPDNPHWTVLPRGVTDRGKGANLVEDENHVTLWFRSVRQARHGRLEGVVTLAVPIWRQALGKMLEFLWGEQRRRREHNLEHIRMVKWQN